MSQPFIAEIRMFGFNFAPRGWAFCDGTLIAIAQNTALFSLLGTNYGGNGQTNFGLPNLQGRAAIDNGQGPGLSPYQLGQTGGNTQVTLSTNQLPQHNHQALASTNSADQTVAQGNVWAVGTAGRGAGFNFYSPTGGANMSQQAIGAAGGGQPHDNMPPYLVVNFCIATQGIFPSRN